MAENMITVSAEAPKPLTVSLVDVVYKIRPIKGSLGMSLAGQLKNAQKESSQDPEKLNKMIDRIIDMMFAKADRPKVKKRLTDPDDDLDFTHVLDLMTKLMERATGNPPTSSSGSSES